MSNTKTPTPPAAPVEDATAADVALAERHAAEAADLVDALEHRVVNGDDTVTHDEIAQAGSLSRFAKLRAEATRRKAERSRAAARLRACHELCAEIEGYSPGAGPRLAELLATAEEAVGAFIDAAQDRNQVVRGWTQQMQDLKVPHGNPLVPPASQGHLGLAEDGQVIAGRRRMKPVDFDHWLTSMLSLIRVTPPGGQPRPLRLDVRPSAETHETLYERLAQLDAPAAEPDPTLRFFRSKASGQVITLDAKALDTTPRVGLTGIDGQGNTGDNHYQLAIKRGDLVEISRREAWGQ